MRPWAIGCVEPATAIKLQLCLPSSCKLLGARPAGRPSMTGSHMLVAAAAAIAAAAVVAAVVPDTWPAAVAVVAVAAAALRVGAVVWV